MQQLERAPASAENSWIRLGCSMYLCERGRARAVRDLSARPGSERSALARVSKRNQVFSEGCAERWGKHAWTEKSEQKSVRRDTM